MRAEIITAKCDRKECKTMIEVERSTVAPEGWLQVTVEIDGKWDQTSKLEFCSAKCVSLWAKARGANAVANGNGMNGSSHGSRIALVREAVSMFEGPFTRTNISEVLPELDADDISSSLQGMKDKGEIKIVGQEPNPGRRAANIYEKVEGGDA